ncbi:MAG: DUF2812 domain-containing protein [Lachnospiraceae bacterium]|nr:DUF2812 domain-containing protein [Lachnospiraceae bacterium]
MAKDKMTKVRWLYSYQKECRWLEEMAMKGWFLENITIGIIYKFRKDEPKRMMYEIDRFNLPKKPTLEEIQHKEIFMEMAQELGWQEVTHDESLTYYFCKEYEEGGINELYNEEESRRYRAQKFGSFLKKQAKAMTFWAMIITIIDVLIRLESLAIREMADKLVWYDWFTLIYVIICCATALFSWKLGEKTEKELSMTRAEWEASVDTALHKTVRKLVLTTRGLSKLLKKEEEKGWILKSVTPTKYFFEKREGGQQVYTMDTKWLTNQRLKKSGASKIDDSKDWQGLSNDWQIQSVKDAQEKGWQFVCALENRTIIYRGDADVVEALNDAKYDYSMRSTSIIGEYGMFLILCGLIGGVIGFFVGLLSF